MKREEENSFSHELQHIWENWEGSFLKAESAELWHFTTGANDGVSGSRIPAIIQSPDKKLEIWYQKFHYSFDIDLGKWYTIELSQTKGWRGYVRIWMSVVYKRNVFIRVT